ncbi:hypothetical protein [Flavitalea sp.]|nr:hypothetical protein [Flavitalea sp.]
MQTTYTDPKGIRHNLEVYKSFERGHVIYIVWRDGKYLMDLVVDLTGKWIDRCEGESKDAEEIGSLVSSLKFD